MKLHLPKVLVAALTAVYAAALPLATTVGTGALVATAATYTAKATEHTDVSGETQYTNGDTYTLSGDTTFTGIPGGGNAATVYANSHSVTLQAAATNTQVVNFVTLNGVNNLTLSQGRYMIDELRVFSGVGGNINICGAQVWFTGTVDYTGDDAITKAMTIEGGTFAEGDNFASMNYSALRIGRDVKISGLLTIGAARETRPAKISFQSGRTLTLSGGMSGSDTLLLGVYDGNNTLAVTGATTLFTGILEFEKFREGSLTVKAESNYGLHVGGIVGYNGVLGLVDGSTTAELTLDVEADQSHSFAGAIANGYSIVKTGEGTQTFSNTANSLSGNIDVQAGTLVYDGTLLNTDSITLTGSSTLALGGVVNITSQINNDAGTLVLKDGVLLKGTGLTVGDNKTIAAGGTFTWTGWSESDLSSLATNTQNVTVQGSIARDFSNVTFENGSTLVIEDKQTVASAPTIAANAAITLEVGAGHTGTWKAAAQPSNTTVSISTVNIRAGGTLIVYQGASNQFCSFNHNKGKELTIKLDAKTESGAATTLETHGSIFGWDTNGTQAQRTVNMGKGSQWLLHAVLDNKGDKSDIWFNNATTVLNQANVTIDTDATVAIERLTNTFRTEATSAGQSTISGGTIKLKNQTQTKLVFDVARSTTLGESSTADLVVSSIITGETANNIEKTGTGILELTAENTFIKAIDVNGGTLRLAGVGGKAGTGAITVAADATLELAHTQDCTTGNTITLNGNLLVSGGNAETLSGNITGGGNLTVNSGTLNLGGTIRLQNGIVINDGGAVNVTRTAMIDLTDLSVSQNSNGYTYYIGAGVNVHTDTRWSLPGGTYDQTSGLYTVVFNHTVTNNSDFRWGSTNAGDDNGQAIPADSLVRFAGNTSINMAANVSVMLMEIAEGAEVAYTANNRTLSVKGKLLLNGSLSLLDTWTLNTGGPFNNGNGGNIQFVVGTNGKLIADWGGKTDGEVTSAKRMGDHPLLADYHGDLIVKDGASCLTTGDRTFSSVTVESGGQFGINGTHTGNITISGNGTKAMSDMQQDYLGALKFSKSTGDGSVLTGNVYVRGGSATISAWDNEKGKINGTINGEDGHSTIIIRNGKSDTSNVNIIKVSGGLKGISVADVQQGTLELLGEGTISNFGDTFTKRGAGTLKIAKTGAMNGGHFVIDGGTVSLGDADQSGTAILKQAEVTVKGGATLTIGHDALGWSGNEVITKLLTLRGGSQTNRALLHNKDDNSNTLKTVINMNGHSRIENASGSTGKVNTLAGFRLNVTGTDNEIATEIQVRDGFVVDISNMTGSGELTISGKISTYDGGSGGLTKTGGGTLILTNTGNDVSREVAILGGTLKLNGAGVKHGAGTLNMDRDTILEVAAGGSGSTTLENTISGRGDLKVSSGTLTLSGTSAVSLDTIHVSNGAGMVIDGTTKTVNVMGTIYSDGTLTVNGSIVMNNADHLEGVVSADGTDGLFSDGANGTYQGGEVYVVKGNSGDSKSDRLGGSGTITIGTDTYYITPGENQVSSDNFTWDQTTGVLTYNYQSATHETGAYYINTDVTYGAVDNTAASDTNVTKLILNGGTLTITSATTLNKNVEVQSDSTLYIDAGAKVESTRITGEQGHASLAGSGGFKLGNSLDLPSSVRLNPDWSGTVYVEGVAFAGNVESKKSSNLNSLANAKSKVGLSGCSGWLNPSGTIAANLLLENSKTEGGVYLPAVKLTDASPQTQTFSGSIDGTGDFVVDLTGKSVSNVTYTFSGDVSQWTGTFDSSDPTTDSTTPNKTINLNFTGTGDIGTSINNEADRTLEVTIGGDGDRIMTGSIANTGTLNLTVEGDGTKTFKGTQEKSVTVKATTMNIQEGTLAIGDYASVTAGGITATANSANPGTAKKVTIGADGIAGDTTTNAESGTLKALGEMSRMTLAFAAENTPVDVSNVTMRDVTLNATNGTVRYEDNVTAVAASTGGAAVSAALYAAEPSETPQTLTATPVQQGGNASGTLTVDIDGSILRPSAGKTLSWTIFDGVKLASGENFTLKLGNVLKTIVGNGKPKVTLSGDWVNNADQFVVLTSADLDMDKLSTNSQISGNLLTAPVGDAGGNLVLTIENVPEPTTGTLSVLALAALAARRRRRE